MGKIVAICVSNKRGTVKQEVTEATFLVDYGIQGDAHADNWHRQVSFLSKSAIDDFNQKGANVTFGAFGENIVIDGIEINKLPVGTWLKSGEVIFEITQIGKECHDKCAIYYRVGECIMPRLGTFARVIHEGIIRPGDEIDIIARDYPLPYQAAVITLSDSGFKGEREDISGPKIKERLINNGYEVVEQILLPDGIELLEKQLKRLCDQRQLDLIITTGGTGFSPRDLTPEATKLVIEREAPGISEAIRAESYKITKKAMLSRGVSGIRGKTLIINLPGSPKACMESMDVFMDVIPHGLDLLRNTVNNCGGK